MSVVPFAGLNGKRRLDLRPGVRHEFALAMLTDVLSAASEVGRVVVVTSDSDGAARARACGADQIRDPGGGQGLAVRAALAALSGSTTLVVNADLPCTTPDDLRALYAAIPPSGLSFVQAPDGTTNALGLSCPSIFVPLYGPGSAQRFRALPVSTVSVSIANLVTDVDTVGDLDHVLVRCGKHTRACITDLISPHLRDSAKF